MKVKKTVTERVLLANRANGRKGRGPNNTNLTRYNAVVHGMLAKKLRFQSEAEKRSFDDLIKELALEHRPCGPTESFQVFIMAHRMLQMGELFGLESADINSRKDTGAAILQGLQVDALELPSFAAIQHGWEAQELLVRSGSQGPTEDIVVSKHAGKTGHLIVAAKMTTTMDTLLRYGSAIKRDYYRALDTLQQLQRDRLELEQLVPVDEEARDEQK